MDQTIVSDQPACHPPANTSRAFHIAAASDAQRIWDLIVIGGGATGAGIALDAASRGYSVLLLEAKDFGKGTSSRSTKLIHGGVRYLGQMQLGMVRESLRERAQLMISAPHLVHELEFVIPCTTTFDRFFYGAGLKLYDMLASGSRMRRSRQLNRQQLISRMPGLAKNKFVGGVAYSDAQFDDTRLLIEILRAAVNQGAIVLNYAPVVELRKNSAGKVTGVQFLDSESQTSYVAQARSVINATGPFCDAIRRMDHQECQPLVAASQGVHIVLPQSFFESTSAMIVPKTSDGRVLFVIPWKGHVLVGTTDTPIEQAVEEPKPFHQELEFLLQTLEEYCGRRPTKDECLCVFTGIRPLVKAGKQQATKKLSRDHTIEVRDSGLVTITGGKWTTYRHMAEDCVDQVCRTVGLPFTSSKTRSIRLDATLADRTSSAAAENLHSQLDAPLVDGLSITRNDLVCGVRFEFARTVEDLLARRTRALFINAKLARQLAPIAAEVLALELGHDQAWQRSQVVEFSEMSQNYSPEHFFHNQ
jgi:glycerol-3-phosphate dehydrogenase